MQQAQGNACARACACACAYACACVWRVCMHRHAALLQPHGAPSRQEHAPVSVPMPAAIHSSGNTEPVVDVLISYKRSDALTFASMLHMALVLRGVGCLLDYSECVILFGSRCRAQG